MLRAISGPKRDEMIGEWRKLRNEEQSDQYSSQNVIQMNKSRIMRHVARMGDGRGTHRVLVGRPGGKRPPARPKRRWEDNSKPYLKKMSVGRGLD